MARDTATICSKQEQSNIFYQKPSPCSSRRRPQKMIRPTTLTLMMFCCCAFLYGFGNFMLMSKMIDQYQRSMFGFFSVSSSTASSVSQTPRNMSTTNNNNNDIAIVMKNGFLNHNHKVVKFPIFKINMADDNKTDMAYPLKRKQNITTSQLLHGIQVLSLSTNSHRSKEGRHDENDYQLYEESREKMLKEIDNRNYDSEWFDSDVDLKDQELECRRNNWKSTTFPTCNSVHEVVLNRPTLPEIRKLGSGQYRDTWLVKTPQYNTEFVLGQLRFIDEYYNEGEEYLETMASIRQEALIMERLSASPRIMNIFGYCSTSIISEAMISEIQPFVFPNNALQSIDSIEVSRNNFTAEEILDMSIQMADALADLHGYKDGVIVHGDVSPEQWYFSKDNNRLMLGDFNAADILDYNGKWNEYCKEYREMDGRYRAPEEYDGYVTESVDTYSLGNTIYSLLTGLEPFSQYDDNGENEAVEIQRKILKGEQSFIDPEYRNGSFVESKLVEIIEATWEIFGSRRISIFDVSSFLKQTKEECASMKTQSERRREYSKTSLLERPSRKHDLVWLMSFPNSGTSYTMHLVRKMSGKRRATNYAGEISASSDEYGQASVYPGQPQGPYWVFDEANNSTSRLVLTKTHCAMFCYRCRLQRYLWDEKHFLSGCAGDGVPGIDGDEAYPYPWDTLKKAVHLFRDPFDNVVSRLHHEHNRNKELTPKRISNVSTGNETKLFRNACIAHNADPENAATMRHFLSPEQFAIVENVPCRTDFVKYIFWHNKAFETAAFLEIDTKVIHYESYESDFEETLKDLLWFIETERLKDATPPYFKSGKKYTDFYTSEERASVEKLFLELASPASWGEVKNYFEFDP